MTKALLKTSDAAHPFELRYESELAGLVIICEPWLAGPYLQRFAILPAFQGCGLGNRVLNWMESEARAMSARQMWLCVSDFNHQARRLYEGFGFKLVARLEKLVSDSADELLMRKMLID